MANKKISQKINKQKEIELKKRRRRKKILLFTIIVLILICIGVYLFTSEEFNIKNIEIVGNKQLKQEEIYELSDIKLGDNIFSTLGIVAQVKIKQNGYIEEAKIKKILPNKIKIEVEERTKKFQILTNEGIYIYIDEQGYLLDYSLDKQELITITGMEITEIGEKKRLEENDLEKMEKILHIISESEQIQIRDQITQISTEDEYKIYLGEKNITINLGDGNNINDKMLYVQAILKEEEGKSGTIYVNGNLNDNFTPYFNEN